MHKKILFLVFGVISVVFISANNVNASPSIQITSPRGGEIFHPGDTIQVQWTSNDVDTVHVSLMNQSTSKTSSAGISNSGSYNIVIPSNILTNAGTALIPSLFTVNITGYQTGIGSTNVNSSTFCITSGSSCPTYTPTTGPVIIAVTSPKGGEIFHPGDTINITWTSSNVDEVSIDLMTDSTKSIQAAGMTAVSGTSYVSVSSMLNTNSYSLTIPQIVISGQKLPSSDRYFISIFGGKLNVGTVKAHSNIFCITSESTCPSSTSSGGKFTSPMKDARFKIGDTINITWQTNDPSEKYNSPMFWLAAESSDGLYVLHPINPYKFDTGNMKRFNSASMITNSLSSGSLDWTIPKEFTNMKGIDYTCNLFPDLSHLCAEQVGGTTIFHNMPFSFTVLLDSNNDYILNIVKPDVKESGSNVSITTIGAVRTVVTGKYRIFGYLSSDHYQDYTFSHPTPGHNLKQTFGGKTSKFFSDEFFIDDTLTSQTAVPAVTTPTAVVSTQTTALFENSIAKSADNPDIYVIQSGKRVRIISPREFEQKGFKWNQIQVVDKSILEKYPLDSTTLIPPQAVAIATKVDLTKTGTLLKAQGGADVYVIQEGQKVKINSPEEFNQKGYKWNQIQEVSTNELSQIPTLTSEAVPAVSAVSGSSTYPNGTLIKAIDGNDVYVIINGKRRRIPDPATFNKFGYKWEQIKKVAGDELSKISDDTAVSIPAIPQATPASSQGVGTGFLVKSIDSPTVYYITPTGMKKPIPSIEVFNSYPENRFENVKIVPQSQIDGYPTANLFKQNSDAKVYFIEDGKKKWVKTEAAFTKRGFDFSKVSSVNGIELDAYLDGEVIE